MNKTTALTAAFALTLTLGLGACGSDDTQSADQTTTQGATGDTTANEDTTGDGTATDGTTDGTTDAAAPGDAGDLTAIALEAIAAAEAEADGTAYEIDDQDDDGTWEVDVAVGNRSVEVTVDASGTTVLKTEDDDDLDDDDRAGLDQATITLSDAIKMAIDEVGGVLDDAELEEEDGRHFWEVSVDGTDRGDDVEVKISVTGEVLGIDD